MRKFAILLLALVALLVGGCGNTDETPTPTPALTTPAPTAVHSPTPIITPRPTPTIKHYSSPPPMTIDQNKQYTATIKTNYGNIVVELLPKEAPLAVNNFVFLARDSYYDWVKFHRVVKGFMIQSGDPTGTGAGGPGYKFADEAVTRDYVRGTLAMANAGPNTNGSQFFITLVDLNDQQIEKKYTIFGLVSSGFDVVQNIGNVPVKANPSMPGENSIPTVDVHIITISIVES